jgi:hypothetical protein
VRGDCGSRRRGTPHEEDMIVGISVLLLAVVSVHVRRFINDAAMFIVCAVVWMFMCVAMPLESPSRVWRMVGLGALGLVLVSCWAAGDVIIRVVRHLP